MADLWRLLRWSHSYDRLYLREARKWISARGRQVVACRTPEQVLAATSDLQLAAADPRVAVALVDDRVVGFMAVSRGADCSWINQLYLLPEWVDRGIGTRLLELAQSELPPPIRLYTFHCNERARCFYERRGFQAIAFGDGSDNEEKCPDILYEWRPVP